MSEIESVSNARILERGRPINDKCCIFEVVFVVEFGENVYTITFVRVGSSFV